MKTVYAFLLAAVVLSCNNNNGNGGASSKIPAERVSVNPNPVKTYTDTVKSFETTDEFKVSLYETKKTFSYLIKISYKNIETDDTLRVPNFGIEPSVEIIKGDKKPSCIVGFLDKDKQFKESKLVYFEDDKLKVHVLKYYAVYADTAK